MTDNPSLSHTLETVIFDHSPTLSLKTLKNHAEALHLKYATDPETATITHKEDALAYALTRMPATTQVLIRCLQEIPDFTTLSSILDIGAGTGSLLWALSQLPQSSLLTKLTLVERNPVMLGLAQDLSNSLSLKSNPTFKHGSLETLNPIPTADLITLNYVCNEVPLSQLEKALPKLWESTHKHLLFIDPGTPENFKKMLRVRALLQDLGAHISAPCGHQAACPLAESETWCHFGVRLSRSKTQKYLKNGEAPFENEKYVYLLVSKEPKESPYNRILSKQQKGKRGLALDLCTHSGRQTHLVPKNTKLSWGDRIPPLDKLF